MTAPRIAILGSIALCLCAGCGGDQGDSPKTIALLEKQLAEKKAEYVRLEKDKDRLVKENTELTAQVREFGTKINGAQELEEKRKALTVKEANLAHDEGRLEEKQELIRQRELAILQKESEFYEATKLTLADIGEAKQIKREYENMREATITAQNRANAWLKYFSVVLILAFVSILLLVVFLTKYHHRNKQIDAAIRILEGAPSLPPRERQLVAEAFCRPLIGTGNADPSASGDGT